MVAPRPNNGPYSRPLLRHKVVLMTRTMGRDIYGGAKETWEDGPAIFANVEPLKGGEYWQQGQLPQAEARVDARIRIRRRNGLSPAEVRVRHGRTVYDLVAVIQDVKGIETQLMVRARALGQGPGQEVNP